MKPSPTLAPQLAAAARMVAGVAAGRSLADEFERATSAIQDSRAALIDLTHGTLRRYGRVQAIVTALSRKEAGDVLLEALLWCALYALDSGRYRSHTVVDEAVKACGLLERWPAKGYVNALLRRFLREQPSIEARLAREEVARFQHPSWWIDLVRGAYPRSWRDVLAAGNTHPPMGLRVNARRSDAARYAAELEAQGMASRPCGAQALLLEEPVPVQRLPGFEAGAVSVQDLGAQRAAHCLDLHVGQRVLDACAAPGGKSAHILELADVELTALDIDAQRAARIAAQLERLGLRARVQVGDASAPQSWWDGQPFDRVLADVPCTASGIARRNPDVKWLRRPSDVARFAAQQRALIDALWRVLAPGGKLLYATCSVFPGENESVVSSFIASEPQTRRLALPDGEPAQWLPEPAHDGFYYALIEKQS